MGLDTTHDCWHGPYSQFMKWRCWLHVHVGGGALDETSLRAAWAAGRYNDQTVPINVLMNHSDCDGSIPTAMCGPLADALEAVLARAPYRQTIGPDFMYLLTKRFIAGLRRASAAGENVYFQ